MATPMRFPISACVRPSFLRSAIKSSTVMVASRPIRFYLWSTPERGQPLRGSHRPLATGKICISKNRALVNSYTRILHKIFWREFYALSRPDNAPGGFFHFQVLAFWYWAGDVSMIQLPRMAVNGRYRLFQVPAFKLALIAGRWRSRTAVAVLRYHRSAHGQ